jgi:hypothetical protein
MTANPSSEQPTPGRIGKQIMLPWTKAVEIAAKSVQVRFGRSMITMSSIVLAIAFLMSIWTSTAIVAALGLGPGRDLAAMDKQIAVLRQAGEDPAAQEQAVEQLAAQLPPAKDRVEETLADLEDQLEEAEGDAEDEIEAQIKEQQTLLESANRFELLDHYLTAQRSKLQQLKVELDTTIEQERAGQAEVATEAEPAEETETPEEEPEAAKAGGFVTDFLSQMTPTDKWLAILALLVCFVGIANAMFMTVQERFREIGTMKCLGALDAFIVKIFLIESAALGLIGTLLGIVIGLLLSVVRQFFVYGFSPVTTYFPLGNLLLAGLMAAVVGLFLSILAAIFPARRAARMEPVEAMRVEE